MLTIQRIETRIDMAIAELNEAREASPTAKEKLARIEEAMSLLNGVRVALRDMAEEERELESTALDSGCTVDEIRRRKT